MYIGSFIQEVHWINASKTKTKQTKTNQNKKKETSSAVNFTKNTFLFSLRDVEKETVKY